MQKRNGYERLPVAIDTSTSIKKIYIKEIISILKSITSTTTKASFSD